MNHDQETDHRTTAMEGAVQNTKDSRGKNTPESSRFLELPDLGCQRSLHSLIEDDLESQENGSFEMARLLRQCEEAVDSDAVTIEAPISHAEVPSEGNSVEPGHPTNSTGCSCDENSNTIKTREKSSTEPTHVSLWKRLFKRFIAIHR